MYMLYTHAYTDLMRIGSSYVHVMYTCIYRFDAYRVKLCTCYVHMHIHIWQDRVKNSVKKANPSKGDKAKLSMFESMLYTNLSGAIIALVLSAATSSMCVCVCVCVCVYYLFIHIHIRIRLCAFVCISLCLCDITYLHIEVWICSIHVYA